MNPVVAKIMTFGAVVGIASIIALSMGKPVLGAEIPSEAGGLVSSNDTAVPGTAQMHQARQQNRCVMDEGYGRWTACSNQ